MGRSRDAAKRGLILEAAFRVFGERGFARTTIKSIAERAGIAPGSVYTYFRDKDELFRSTVEEGWDSFLERLEGIRASRRPFRQRMLALVDTGFLVLEETLPLLRGMLFEASQRKLFHTKLEKLCESVEKLILEGIRQRGKAGRIRAPTTQWSKLLRITIIGILFSVASAEPGKTGGEIRILKQAVTARLAALLGGARGSAR
jgi:AcrR family transcriptional regulator